MKCVCPWIRVARLGFVSVLVVAGCNANEKGGGDRALAPTGTSSSNNASGAGTGDSSKSTPNIVTPIVGATSGSDVLATIDGIPITRAAVEKPLIEAYGLGMLAKVAQLELAKREAAARGVTVTDKDIDAETERYLISLFNEEKDPVLRQMNADLDRALTANDAKRADEVRAELRRERFRLLDQLLQQQKLSRADFDLAMQTNTYLRKIALAVVKKDAITEENLQQAFNQLYGEKVQVRVIALRNIQEATEAKRRVAWGEPFEKVAREMSTNQQSAMMGGELPPFSRDNGAYPQQFKDVAFALRPGEISDTVAAAGGYHIIKLEQRIPPKVVKFEDYRTSVRDDLFERQIEQFSRVMSTELKRASLTSMKISEPVMRKQFDEQVLKKDDEVKDKNDVRRELDRRRQAVFDKNAASTQPTTAPAETMPSTAPTTKP